MLEWGTLGKRGVWEEMPGPCGQGSESFRVQWRWWAPPAYVTPDRARWGSFSVRHHSPGSSIQKSVHFLPCIKMFGFSFFNWKLPKVNFFSRIQSKIYLYHSVIFLDSKFISVQFGSYV